MDTKEKYASGDYVVPKAGGPKMMVKWYIDAARVETCWNVGRAEKIADYNEDELERYVSIDANGIYVIDSTIEPADGARFI
jgi:uncharacterized protein YodC (DUF2158 family)